MSSKKPTKGKFSAKQIRAQKRFAQMARARAKAARAAKRTNPTGKHLPRATKKQQRQYEHILQSARASARYKGREKEVAARTVRTHGNPTVIKAKRVRISVVNPQINQIVRDYIRAGRNQKSILAHMRATGFTAAQIAEAKRVYPKEAAFVKRLRVRNKGGLSEADIARLPEAAQRQIRAQLGRIEEAEEKATSPKARRAVQRRRRSLISRIGTRLRLIGQTKKFKVEARDLGRCKRKTVKVRGRHETDALAKAQSKLGPGYDQFRVRNSSNRAVKKIRREFSGRNPRRTTTMKAPAGTPVDLAKLGTLVSIKTSRGRMLFKQGNPSGETWLCADSKGRMHLATSLPALTDERARNFGKVLEIEYIERKPHLGHKKRTLFFHKMGEEGGAKPELVSDSRGGLRFRGGDYYLSRDGIRN